MKMHHANKRLKISENSDKIEKNYQFSDKSAYYGTPSKGNVKFPSEIAFIASKLKIKKCTHKLYKILLFTIWRTQLKIQQFDVCTNK